MFKYVLDKDIEDKIYSELNVAGISCLENVIDDGFLNRCRADVDKELVVNGERYFSLYDKWEDNSSPFGQMGGTSEFRKLVYNLAARSTGISSVENAKTRNVLRIVAGIGSDAQAMKFHYDASTITALFPLRIPDGVSEEVGDLIIYPNRRPIRKNVFANLFDKILVQNPIGRHLLARNVGTLSDGKTIVRLKPGNLYFFWGYRTLHANFPVRDGELRATMLFHVGEPHNGSLLTTAVANIRNTRERKILEQKKIA